MARKYSSLPGFMLDLVRGRARGVSVISGADGPTAIFVARIHRPELRAVRAAAGASLALAVMAAVFAAVVYIKNGR